MATEELTYISWETHNPRNYGKKGQKGDEGGPDRTHHIELIEYQVDRPTAAHGLAAILFFSEAVQ